MVREVRTRLVDAPQDAVFRAFSSLGGERGWRVWEWLWSIRGLRANVAPNWAKRFFIASVLYLPVVTIALAADAILL